MPNNTTSPLKFTGTIPKNYDTFLGPMFFEEYAEELANRIDPSGVHVALELCCGTGRVTRHLRRVLSPSTTLIATDLSPEMLAVAQDQSKTGVDFRIMNAQEIALPDKSVDVIVCSFGYMFVSDLSLAFADALRVLRPGGKLLFSTWDKLENNGASYVHRSIVKKYFGDTLPASYKLPFSLNDPKVLEEKLKKAGFSKVSVEHVKKNSYCVTAKEAAYGLVEGSSLYNEIMDHHPDWLSKIKSDVEDALAEEYGNSPVIAPMSAFIAEAHKD